MNNGALSKDAVSELATLKLHFDTPFIVSYIDSIQEKNELFIILEYGPFGDLRHAIVHRIEHRLPPFTEDVCA